MTPSSCVASGMWLDVPGARLSCRHLAQGSVSSTHTTGWGLKPSHHSLTASNPSAFQSPGTLCFCFQNISVAEPSKRVTAITKSTDLQGMVVKSSASVQIPAPHFLSTGYTTLGDTESGPLRASVSLSESEDMNWASLCRAHGDVK